MSNPHQQSAPSVYAQRGLTLIEILVALTLSAFLIAGVIQLFIGSKQTYRGHDALSRIQENGRFALDAMSRDIRMAGYTPAPGQLPSCPTPVTSPPSPPFVQSTNTTIQVWWCDPGAASPQCTPASGICTRGYLIACRGGEAPPCTGVGMGDLMLQHESVGGNQPFIEGVADMRITPVACPGFAVCSVTIDLLLVSLDRFLATQPQTVIFPPGSGTPYTAPDRRLVQIFSTTVAIRNR